jgi:hypothetical protein
MEFADAWLESKEVVRVGGQVEDGGRTKQDVWYFAILDHTYYGTQKYLITRIDARFGLCTDSDIKALCIL